MRAVNHDPVQPCRTEAKRPRADLDGRAELYAVERHMLRTIRGSQIDRAGLMALEQIATGGKRLRARLALAAARAFGVGPERATPWAAAVELLHNATLVHDDVQDGDRTRRGEPTLWVRHGVAQAINAGDLLLMLPFLALSDLPGPDMGRLCQAIADYAARVVRGQVEELGLLTNGKLDVESYLHAVAGKTGGLIALPVVGAALLAGRSAERAAALGDVFAQLGVLFQLQDDVVDLFGDKGRGEVGCDIYEGKISALVVAHVERDPASTPELLALLAKPRASTTPSDVERARQLFLSSSALEAVLRQIEQLQRRTLGSAALAEEPELTRVAEQLVTLALAPIEHLFLQDRGTAE